VPLLGAQRDPLRDPGSCPGGLRDLDVQIPPGSGNPVWDPVSGSPAPGEGLFYINPSRRGPAPWRRPVPALVKRHLPVGVTGAG